jgi:hypothetical protein
MALDYAATAALMQNVAFHDRTKIACLHYATYILGEAVSVPAHSSRLRWAQNTTASPDQSAVNVMPILVMDDKVQADGDAISDANLQIAVETSVNQLL